MLSLHFAPNFLNITAVYDMSILISLRSGHNFSNTLYNMCAVPWGNIMMHVGDILSTSLNNPFFTYLNINS